MKRAALYSNASRSRTGISGEPPQPEMPAAGKAWPARRRALGDFIFAHRTAVLLSGAILAASGGALLQRYVTAPPAVVTQQDIDRAVRQSLEKKPLPSKAARAFGKIGPSVVRVAGYDHPGPAGSSPPLDGRNPDSTPRMSVGTGVVITEKGAILTNLHVVNGARRIEVTFADGTRSEAMFTGADPGNDLAVLQARTLPDDLQPATLVTTGDLKEGDEVVAVGFPFGYGPSVSMGVVSGLKREFRSADGKRALGNLIQFDAAANPGNSGGPLVNMEGEVLGIVTAIYNPTRDSFFVGLGFAVPIENAAAAVGVHPF